jgi:hypothetical protein
MNEPKLTLIAISEAISDPGATKYLDFRRFLAVTCFFERDSSLVMQTKLLLHLLRVLIAERKPHMRTRLWMSSTAVSIFCIAALTDLQAVQPAASVYETQEGSNTEYSVSNTSNLDPQPFDITVLVVSTRSDSPNPSTTNLNWIAEPITASTWTQAMGAGVSSLPTWQQYTGMNFIQAFGDSDPLLNGYFLNYTYDSGNGNVTYLGNPIFPSSPLQGGFFFEGTALHDLFLVEGPIDATVPTPLAQVQNYYDMSEVIPEPSSLLLTGLGAVTLCAFLKRKQP